MASKERQLHTLVEIKKLLEVQELDMQMLQLMRVKKERLRELEALHRIRLDLEEKKKAKEQEIQNTKKDVSLYEGEVKIVVDRIKALEDKQGVIKKVEEFNALSQEISQAERERTAKEHRLSDLYDQLAAEEEALAGINESLGSTIESSKMLEKEINDGISRINAEGREIKEKRDVFVGNVDPEFFRIYDRLFRNKKDRVVVPIENRCCSGCHIMLTAQHENVVRKGEKLVFCDYCSRIHFWPEGAVAEQAGVVPKPRRRRPREQAVQ